MKSDILIKTEEYVFSYRVAGILIQDGKVLLQSPINVEEFAFPGGHVAFGETNAETLIREYQEEIGVDISVGDLKWVGEVFFSWGNRPCHQICLYYEIALKNRNQIPLEGSFIGNEDFEDNTFQVEFHWIPIDTLFKKKVYPTNVTELMGKYHEGVQHFIYKEEEL